ncbi:regulator of V-ATPase [Scheffersomyces coipomensis]|uniref:regulator of V-ATPase n=1 Tax=Scheffersomyces coipomensis TaxID=1788519 RepID=UPI00315D49E7
MTITFVPGEVNKGPYSVQQVVWKTHHIIVYGSGNNLIICSGNLINPSAEKVTPNNLSKNLQTIYLEADPVAIDINPDNGLIVISINSKIIVYKPVNEFMVKPKWTEALQFEIEDKYRINCLRWAADEQEVIVGTSNSLILYHIYDEYGTIKYNNRWYSQQSNSITDVKITRSGNKIMTVSGPYDRLLKVWSRMNYGDDNTLFELSYLSHPKDSYILDFHWRISCNDSNESDGNNGSNDKKKVIDSSMAGIKNIRGYIHDNDEDEGEVIYTITNDFKLNVWASHEFSGHSHIMNWSTLDLSKIFKQDDSIACTIIIENHYLQKSLLPFLSSSSLSALSNLEHFDLLLVVSKSGNVIIYTIENITSSPLNNVKFTQLNPHIIYKFDSNTFPISSFDMGNDECINSSNHKADHDTSKLSIEYITSEEFVINHIKPILIPDVSYLIGSSDQPSPISLLIHDRIKNTIRFNGLLFSNIINPTEEKVQSLGAVLINKLQGHTKSIRKLIKSNSSFSDKNILLSISNFPEHNYIWEPLLLNISSTKNMTLTKRFQLNVKSESDDIGSNSQGIWTAVIINDIEPPKLSKRRHLVVSIDKNSVLSFWDCDGSINDDQPAELINTLEIMDNSNKKIITEPQAFVLTTLPVVDENTKEYCIVAIFSKELVRAWKISIHYNEDKTIESFDFSSLKIDGLPHPENVYQLVTIDNFINAIERSLIAVIDEEGLLRSFALNLSAASTGSISWKETHTVHTGVKRASKIHGATFINKLAVIDETGYNLSIWNLRACVLEYEETFPEDYGKVKDIDWTFINASKEKSTSNAILSIGFGRFVLLYTQLRYDYTNNIPTFAMLKKIDISDYTSHEIGDSIWLNDGYLIIGSGNQFFIDDKWIQLGSGSLDTTIRQLMIGYTKTRNNSDPDHHDDIDDGGGYKRIDKSSDELVYDISHLVRILNGPLPIYHPQFLAQALFMSQTKLVQDILVKLFSDLRQGDPIAWDLNMEISKEIMSIIMGSHSGAGEQTPKTEFLQAGRRFSINLDIFKNFDSNLADMLIEKLMKISLPLLTRHQQSTLISIILIVKDLKQFTLSLDDNGIRFFIGFKLFQLSTKQSKLSMRDINWALHSENKEMLLNLVEDYFKSRLKWENIKQTGLVYWVHTEGIIKLIESAARNEFSDSRDPSGRVSLFYLALRKKQILLGLWRNVTHSEKQKMLAFLSNDFTQKRWKSAALKNAFVLLGKHRYLDSAYFFLLGDSVKDCCSILANKLEDIPLAIAIAKVYNATDPSLISSKSALSDSLRLIIENFILPESIQNGNRWTTSWIFWQMNLKELSIQALVKSPLEMIESHGDKFSEFCNTNFIQKISTSTLGQSFLRDDPVLILLFNDLRQKKSNYLKGSMGITPIQEFEFIKKVCGIYTRMGCDYLALLLVRNWNFVHTKEVRKITNNEAVNGNGAAVTINGIQSDTNGSSQVPNMLESFNIGSPTTEAKFLNRAPPPQSVFEEPDMGSFNFGF